MAQPQLRIYYGPQEETTHQAIASSAADRVSIPLQDILPVLAEAARKDCTWLRDFADDEIQISTDLYEVILAYQHYRRPSA